MNLFGIENSDLKFKNGYKSVDAEFIKSCDADLEKKLAEGVSEFCRKKDARVLGLTGPTCSGKTTAAKKLTSYLGDESKRVIPISLDDFFKDTFSREMLKDADITKLDFDSPDTIDIDLFAEFIENIFNKGEAKKPIFDFTTGTRAVWENVVCDDDDILLLEGIQVLYPSIMAVTDRFDVSVMGVRVESGIEICDRKFAPDFIRFCRRLVRDFNFRASDTDLTWGLWNSVTENERLNILPYMSKCDVCIDTTLPYELNVLAPYLRNILKDIPSDKNYYKDAMDMLMAIDGIDGIDSKVISDNSLYKEFV